MKFETWIKKQKKRDDRVGDLANDYIKAMSIESRNPYAVRAPYNQAIQILESMSKWNAGFAAYGSLQEAWHEYCEQHQEHACLYKEMIKFMKDNFQELDEEGCVLDI